MLSSIYRFFKILFFAITIFATVSQSALAVCPPNKGVLALFPFYSSNDAPYLESILQKFLNDSYDVTLKLGQEANREAFNLIKNDSYSIILIQTHSNPKVIGTGELANYDTVTDEYNKNNEIDGKFYFGLTPNWWDDVDLSDKIVILIACNALTNTNEEGEIVDILLGKNIRAILGFKHFVASPFGAVFFDKYFLKNDIFNEDTPLDLLSAFNDAKNNYFELDDYIFLLHWKYDQTAKESSAILINEDLIKDSGEESVIYFACVPPVADIKFDGVDFGPIAVYTHEGYDLNISLDCGTYARRQADYWIYVDTPSGRYFYDGSQYVTETVPFMQENIVDIDSLNITELIPSDLSLNEGMYTFTFAVDDNADGLLNGTWQDSVTVNFVKPPQRDPIVDIKINGSDNPIEVNRYQFCELSFSLNTGDHTGEILDFWLYIDTPSGRRPLMTPTLDPIQVPIEDFTFSEPMYFDDDWELGTYIFHFALDNNADGVLDGTWSDSVQMTIVEMTETECLNLDRYWWDNACHDEPRPLQHLAILDYNIDNESLQNNIPYPASQATFSRGTRVYANIAFVNRQDYTVEYKIRAKWYRPNGSLSYTSSEFVHTNNVGDWSWWYFSYYLATNQTPGIYSVLIEVQEIPKNGQPITDWQPAMAGMFTVAD